MRNVSDSLSNRHRRFYATDTEAVISCIISGITEKLDSVSWTNSSDATLTNGTDYLIGDGIYDESSNSQTATLTVKGVKPGTSTADATFTCVVTSAEWNITGMKTEVTLTVFGTTD